MMSVKHTAGRGDAGYIAMAVSTTDDVVVVGVRGHSSVDVDNRIAGDRRVGIGQLGGVGAGGLSGSK